MTPLNEDLDWETASPPAGAAHEERRSTRSSGAWMLTFTDLVLLMLTFFVMMYAMSSPRTEAIKAMIESVASRFATSPNPPSPPQYAVEQIVELPAINLPYLTAVLSQMRERTPALEPVEIEGFIDRIELRIPLSALVAPGKSEVSEAGKTLLSELGVALSRIGNRVIVEGVSKTWMSALERAVVIAHDLREAGYPDSVGLQGAVSLPGASEHIVVIVETGGKVEAVGEDGKWR